MKSKTFTYQIMYIERVKNSDYGKNVAGGGDKYMGGDANYITETIKRSVAIKIGKQLSFKKKIKGDAVHEIFIRKEDEIKMIAEIIFIKNGIITHTDSFPM